MCATINSAADPPAVEAAPMAPADSLCSASTLPGAAALLYAALLILLWPHPACSAADSLRQRAERAYLEARERFRQDTTNAAPAWVFARACFDWAEFARDDEQRAQIAQEGIEACQKLLPAFPASAPLHYYLALNYGQLARTKTVGALALVRKMEHEFKIARELDRAFDYAGADRSLGMLYAEAPAWPASIGSREKAREHLQRAVKLSPDYPDNRLALLEAYLKWDELDKAQAEGKQLSHILPRARKRFSGQRWEASWADWDRRWTKAQARLKK